MSMLKRIASLAFGAGTETTARLIATGDPSLDADQEEFIKVLEKEFEKWWIEVLYPSLSKYIAEAQEKVNASIAARNAKDQEVAVEEGK